MGLSQADLIWPSVPPFLAYANEECIEVKEREQLKQLKQSYNVFSCLANIVMYLLLCELYYI